MCIIFVGKNAAGLALREITGGTPHKDGVTWYRAGQERLRTLDYRRAVRVLADANPHADDVVFLRWATHGEISERNISPFYTGNGYLMWHNGVMHNPYASAVKRDVGICDWYSDSAIFAAVWRGMPIHTIYQAALYQRSSRFYIAKYHNFSYRMAGDWWRYFSGTHVSSRLTFDP